MSLQSVKRGHSVRPRVQELAQKAAELADLPGLQMLGEKQMQFLREWAADWRGADMKAVISQTIFSAMATTHGGGHEVLVADYDANGWPLLHRPPGLSALGR